MESTAEITQRAERKADKVEDETLLSETLERLAHHGKSPADVRWVGNDVAVGSWEDFAALADFDYDHGYGGAEIEESLVVVGDDWWLERGEYDGSEWWAFKTLPTKPTPATPLVPQSIMQNEVRRRGEKVDHGT